jgi:hypothetical protein
MFQKFYLLSGNNSISTMASTAQLLEDSLLVIWNDRDAARRLEGMRRVYSNDMRFFESNEGAPIVGYEAINALIAKLQSTWPPEFTFELTKPSQVNHNIQKITWRLGIKGQPPVATGADVAIIEGDKIASLYLFLDAN